ncbi:sensor histidine kinase [Comamonas composti]|uniref:sensor histidine kinase n=1 Tax=Comamonas composti TaxID=408558 RepID=UPI000478AB2B|nr:ATP-binding protein [Comamonas composti]
MAVSLSLRKPLLFLLWLGLSGLGGGLAYLLSLHLGTQELQATGLSRLEQYDANLQREIDKYAFLPQVLELQGDVRALVRGAAGQQPDPDLIPRVNAYLQQLNRRAQTLVIYVLDGNGLVRAASNWSAPDSYMGEDLSFRPYFRDAMSSGSGRFFGIGTTRGEPGYYLASALGQGAQRLGVVVVKLSLDQLEQSWFNAEAPVIVADENGVVILSTEAGWKFATLRPLDQARRAMLERTQQYNRRALRPLGVEFLRSLGPGAHVARIKAEGQVLAEGAGGRYLAQSQALAGTPWTLTVMSSLAQVHQLAQSRAVAVGAGIGFLLVLALMLDERRRRLREQLSARAALQKAHDELEVKVQQRTADLSASNQALQDEIVERRRAEATLRAAQDELVQAGKLAAIGQLATGVAHELNQPLTALRTLAGNSQRFLERGDTATTYLNLQRMGDVAERMGRITGQLRNFARKSSGSLEAVSLVRAMDNVLSLLELRIARRQVRVVRQVDAVEPVAWCDRNRIEQVLVNLVSNALDAMQDVEHPVLELACGVTDGMVELSVRDHGPGLAPEALNHLFQPFFTTKEEGRGLGLGLALSASIVRECAGTLTGRNHPQGGAVFTLRLTLASTCGIS